MNKKKALFSAAALIIVLALAVFGYKYLSKFYTPEIPSFHTENADTEETPSGETPKESESPAPDAEETETYAAPDFTLPRTDGSLASLSDFLGRPVVLNFWATWCGPCKSELPAFEKAYQIYGDKVEFMMINLTDGAQETEESVLSFLDKNGYTFPVYYDSEIYTASIYGAYAIPLTVFIDAEGNILTGFMTVLDEETLFSHIEILIEMNTEG